MARDVLDNDYDKNKRPPGIANVGKHLKENF